jgi:DNA primase
MQDLIEIARICNQLLRAYPQAADIRFYLDQRLSREIQDQYLFGYFPGSSEINLITDIYDVNKLKSAELVRELSINSHLMSCTTYSSFFEDHRLVIPFIDTYGKVISMAGRTLLSSKDQKERKVGKYKNTTFEKGNYLFNLNAAKEHIIKQNCVYVVEGQIDAIVAYERGLKNVVASCGSSLTDWQFSLLLRYTKNIIILFDNDSGGDKGRKQIYSRYGDFANIVDKRIPDPYKDVDEFLQDNDFDTLQFRLNI